MTKIDNIRTLYQDNIIDKEDFFEKCADEFKLKKSSVRANWFSRFEIPERYQVQDTLIIFMQNYIRNNGNASK